MFGTVSEEMEVKVPAKQAWELYGSIQLSKFVVECLPEVFAKVEIVEGDGGLGTVLNIVFVPGVHGFTSYKEKFTKIDNEKLVKETEAVEGAYLDIGFTLFRVRFEIFEKTENSCITRSTIEYEVKEEAAANASVVSIQPLVMIMKTAASYLIKEK